MKHDWRKVPICKENNEITLGPGLIFNIWTVGPRSMQYPSGCFTSSVWAVRHIKTGVGIGYYTDLNVAINFAQWLWRTYGDITESCINLYRYAETPADKALFDEIDEKSMHACRIKGSEIRRIPFVRFDPVNY